MAEEDVQKLWQFIDAGAADEPADPSQPIVLDARRNLAAAVGAFEPHAAELQKMKDAVVLTHALLGE